jgi:hypothetical protein
VHGNSDFVADFKLPWDGVGLFRHRKIVRHLRRARGPGLGPCRYTSMTLGIPPVVSLRG